MEHMIDDDTGLIEETIPDVLEYLFTNYGRVKSEEVTEREAAVGPMPISGATAFGTSSLFIFLHKKRTHTFLFGRIPNSQNVVLTPFFQDRLLS